MPDQVIIAGDSNAYVKIPRRDALAESELALRLLTAGYDQSVSGAGDSPENQTGAAILEQYLAETPNSQTSTLIQSLLATTAGQHTLAVILPQILAELKKNREPVVARVTITTWSRNTTHVTAGLPGRPRLYKLGWVQWFESEISDYASDAQFLYYEKQLFFSPHPRLRVPRLVLTLGAEGTVEII